MAASEPTSNSESTILKVFVAVLFVICLVGVAALQPTRLDGWPRLVLLALLTALASTWSVRIKALGLELTPTDPFLLFALATAGPWAAVFLAVVAVAGAGLWRGQNQRWVCNLFNFVALPLSTALAGFAFVQMGGGAESPLAELLGPLSGAALIFLLANTGLTAGAIALSRKESFLRGWGGVFLCTLWPAITSLMLAFCMLLLVAALGPWGLVLALPPVFALAATQQVHKIWFEKRHAATALTSDNPAELAP